MNKKFILLKNNLRSIVNIELDSGSPTVFLGDNKITEIKPLVNKKNSFTSKAGQLSFSGFYNGRKVKIYSAFTEQQALFRADLNNFQSGNFSLPEVEFIYKNIVVESWIKGRPPRISGSYIKSFHPSGINFLNALNSIEVRSKFKSDNFCYINNYLFSRLKNWKDINPINKLLNYTKLLYEASKTNLPMKVGHPDLAPRNIIIERNSKKLYLIDNELLGYGHGWLLDKLNFKKSLNLENSISELLKNDVLAQNLWNLRLLSSSLESGRTNNLI